MPASGNVCFWAGGKMSANQSSTKTEIFWRKSALHCRFDSYGMDYEYNTAYRVKKLKNSSVLFSKTRTVKKGNEWITTYSLNSYALNQLHLHHH